MVVNGCISPMDPAETPTRSGILIPFIVLLIVRKCCLTTRPRMKTFKLVPMSTPSAQQWQVLVASERLLRRSKKNDPMALAVAPPDLETQHDAATSQDQYDADQAYPPEEIMS